MGYNHSMIKIKVHHPMADYSERFAPGVISKIVTYTGEIVSDSGPYIEFKHDYGFVGKISKSRVISIDNVEFNYTPVKDIHIQVKGSKGNVYDVVRRDGHVSCSCPAFKFRKKCKHMLEAA